MAFFFLLNIDFIAKILLQLNLPLSQKFEKMELQFLGHSTFALTINNKTLVIDPFVSASEKSKSIDLLKIKADYILITHGHQDHVLDVETIAAHNENVLLISNYEIVSWFGQKGVKGHGLNFGGKVDLDGISIKYVYAAHSSMLPDGSYGGNPGGFIIWDKEQSIYVAGDTGLTMEMKLIPEFFPNLNVAILPIGDTFTMGYEEALIASDFIKCNQIIGCHFDTFPPIEIDHKVVTKAFESRNKSIVLPSIGQTIII